MRPALLLTLCAALTLTGAAAAQFSAHPWSFSGAGTTGFSGGSVSGVDEITLEVLNCFGYAGSARAESVAHDTGRYAFDLTGEEWIDSGCSQCGLAFCGGTTVWALNDCDACPSEWGIWLCEPEQAATFGGNCHVPQAWSTSWEIEVVEGRCWSLSMAQDGWSLDCNTRVIASNLTFTPAPDVVVASVSATPAYLSNLVRIRGQGLGHVDQVLLDGVDEPILTHTDDLIVIRPPAGAPGFVSVTLRNDDFLLAIEEGALSQLPTLAAQFPPGGQNLEVGIEAGVPGNWQLVVGLGETTPYPLGPETYAHLVVDVFIGHWLLLSGALDSQGSGGLVLPVPQDPTLSGIVAHLQVLAPAGFGGAYSASFTNAVEVVVP